MSAGNTMLLLLLLQECDMVKVVNIVKKCNKK
jgi:hypothetical protein